MDTETVAQLSAVSKRRGAVLALDTLDLAVRRGEVYALLGPNGAGKTTAISLLLGLLRADSGEARLFGLPPTGTCQRQHGENVGDDDGRQARTCSATAMHQHMRQQVRIHVTTPCIAPLPLRPPRPHQHGQRGQGPQPLGAQEMQGLPIDTHARLRGHTKASNDTASAPASGHA